MKDLEKFNSKVLVIGAYGQVGSEIRSIQDKLNFSFDFPTSKELNLLKLDSFEDYLDHGKYDLVINLAAYTDVELSEKNKEKANIINNLSLDIIAKETYRKNIGLIHASTDYVFGDSGGPYNSNDKKSPINFYGLTKSLGEDLILQEHKRSMVIRFSSVFSEYGNNFAKKIINRIINNSEVEVVTDQKISLTYAGDFAKNLENIIKFYYDEAFDSFQDRIFHFSSDDYTDWYTVAKIIHQEMINFDKEFTNVNLIPISSNEWHSMAKRSSDSRLMIDKEFMNLGNIILSNWKDRMKYVVNKVIPSMIRDHGKNG